MDKAALFVHNSATGYLFCIFDIKLIVKNISKSKQKYFMSSVKIIVILSDLS